MTLLEVPIGFTLAMSCVLANRVVLNVRRAGQVVNLTDSRKPMTGQEHNEHDGSSCSRGALSRHEMVQLRSMRSDCQLTDMVKSHNSGWVGGLSLVYQQPGATPGHGFTFTESLHFPNPQGIRYTLSTAYCQYYKRCSCCWKWNCW